MEVYAPYGAYQVNAKMVDFGKSISIIYQVNRTTEKYHVIISISTKKSLDKIKCVFVIKKKSLLTKKEQKGITLKKLL